MSTCRRCGSTDPTVRNQVFEPGPGRWEPCHHGWHNVTRVLDSTLGPRVWTVAAGGGSGSTLT